MHQEVVVVSPTYGSMAVDWEDRLSFPRLRNDRLSRLKAELAGSGIGALLTFDFHNIRCFLRIFPDKPGTML